MKKFLAAILAVIYLSTSMGATVHLHYCMDKLVAWGFGEKGMNKKSCPYCGMTKATNTDKHCGKESKGCCKDEQKQVKLENDQKVAEAAINLSQIPAEATAPIFTYYSFEYFSSLKELYPLTHAPPRTKNIALFVLNCDFRI